MLVATSCAFVITLACLFGLVSSRIKRAVLDRPNERSLHVAPVPRTGGLAIGAGVAGSLAVCGYSEFAPMFIALALAVVSFGDDLFGLPALLRLGIHLAASAGFLWLSAVSGEDPITFVLLLLGIAWLTNLFNFMDGSDGLAGGMAVVGFGVYAFAAHTEGVAWLATACGAIGSAALAFLLFNFPPAKIFMGDSGSIPLGFLAGVLGVAGWQAGIWGWGFPLLVFSPFAVDATFTLGKRLLRGERVWQAHREHYYQRLVRMGFGHRNTALAEYLLMAICAAAALATRNTPSVSQAALLALFGAVYIGLALAIDVRWARYAKDGAP